MDEEVYRKLEEVVNESGSWISRLLNFKIVNCDHSLNLGQMIVAGLSGAAFSLGTMMLYTYLGYNDTRVMSRLDRTEAKIEESFTGIKAKNGELSEKIESVQQNLSNTNRIISAINSRVVTRGDVENYASISWTAATTGLSWPGSSIATKEITITRFVIPETLTSTARQKITSMVRSVDPTLLATPEYILRQYPSEAKSIPLCLLGGSEYYAPNTKHEKWYFLQFKKKLDALITKHPKSWQLFNQIGCLAFECGYYSETETNFDRARQLAPSEVKLTYNKALACLLQKKTDVAMKEIASSLQKKPNYAPLRLMQTILSCENKPYAQMKSEMDKLLGIAGFLPDYWGVLGYFSKKDNPSEAYKCFSRGLAISSSHTWLRYQRASLGIMICKPFEGYKGNIKSDAPNKSELEQIRVNNEIDIKFLFEVPTAKTWAYGLNANHLQKLNPEQSRKQLVEFVESESKLDEIHKDALIDAITTPASYSSSYDYARFDKELQQPLIGLYEEKEYGDYVRLFSPIGALHIQH